MPHQCLSCGHAFQEGSSEILNGCPRCKGTRFFYTDKPVTAQERQRLQGQAQKDLGEVVTELLQESAPEVAKELKDKADADGWAALKPSDLRRLVKKVQASAPAKKVAVGDNEPVESPKRRKAVEDARARILAELEEVDEHPDTVNVKGAGEYEIDIKALMERDPIVVHRDGAYMIHLPSLFDGKQK